MTDEQDYWYSADAQAYSTCSISVYGTEEYGTTYEAHLRKHPVLRHTPKGVVLGGLRHGETFVRGDAIRQAAVPTKGLAIADAIHRKLRKRQIMLARAAAAEREIAELLRLGKREGLCDAEGIGAWIGDPIDLAERQLDVLKRA